METRSRQYARLSYSIYYGVKTNYYVLSLNEGLLRYFPIFRERTVEGQTEKPCRTRFSRRLQSGHILLNLHCSFLTTHFTLFFLKFTSFHSIPFILHPVFPRYSFHDYYGIGTLSIVTAVPNQQRTRFVIDSTEKALVHSGGWTTKQI
jgi:hypothetical protein